MKKVLLLTAILMVCMVGSVSATKLLTLDGKGDCSIVSVEEFGTISYYLESPITIRNDGTADLEADLIRIRLPIMQYLIGQEVGFCEADVCDYPEIMNFDFDSALNQLGVSLYFSEARNYEGSTYIGRLNDGTILFERTYLYGMYILNPNWSFFYGGLDLANEETGETMTGRILFGVDYNISAGLDNDRYTEGYVGGCSVEEGYLILDENDFEERISSLESWKQTIDDWKDTISDLIQNIIDVLLPTTNAILEEQNDTIQDHEQRLSSLEDFGGSGDIFPDYLRRLSSSQRKKVVCAYAEDKGLFGIEGLGWTCGLTYKKYSSGRIKARCSCKKTR